jgi:hypothetical protein
MMPYHDGRGGKEGVVETRQPMNKYRLKYMTFSPVKLLSVSVSGQSSDETDDRPYFITLDGTPTFRGEFVTSTHLLCAFGCNRVLIENYLAEDFLDVGIQCPQCRGITRTPSLIAGETFASVVYSFGDAGQGPIYLKTTVDVLSGHCLTWDREIARALQSTAPRPRFPPLDVSESGLQSLSRRYEEIVGKPFALQRNQIKR